MFMNALDRAKRAAADQLRGLKPADAFRSDHPFYVREPADNLVPGVTLEDFQADFDAADGKELRDGSARPAKFCASYSSAALAVNTFAPFKKAADALTVHGIGGFIRPLQFEARCPNGLQGDNGAPSRSPNLDVLAFAGDTVVAVESKFLEPLSIKKQSLSARYAAPFLGNEGTPAFAELEWSEMYRRVSRMALYPKEDLPYTRVNAARLLKYYLGLKVSYPLQPRVLVYLYWEPANASAMEAYRRHRLEVDDFARRVAGCDTTFVALSYPDLWSEWQATSIWPGMPEHLARLRERYRFAI